MIYDMIVILITLPYNLVFLLLFQDLKNKNLLNESCMIIHHERSSNLPAF